MYTKRALYLYIYIIFLFIPLFLTLIKIVRKAIRSTLVFLPLSFSFFLSLYTSLIIYKKTLPYLYNYTMIYVSTNAQAPTIFVRVYQYRERLVLSFPPFFLPPLNSPVITDINKCILYKTMYKFHSTHAPLPEPPTMTCARSRLHLRQSTK